MPQPVDTRLLQAILDSWDRNNRIMINLLGALPSGLQTAHVMAGSPSIVEMFAHVVYVRLVFISEDAPEWSDPRTPEDWLTEKDLGRLTEGLQNSGSLVRKVVEDYLGSGKQMQQHYDHPLLFLQHMIWHEGYHHGQIKLALKLAGHALEDEQIGPLTWDIWIDKTGLS